MATSLDSITSSKKALKLIYGLFYKLYYPAKENSKNELMREMSAK